MFGIGSTELLVILVVALLVLGPQQLPKIAQTLGKAMGEFRRMSTDFQRTLNTEIAFEEAAQKRREEEKKTLAESAAPATPEAASPQATQSQPASSEPAQPEAASPQPASSEPATAEPGAQAAASPSESSPEAKA